MSDIREVNNLLVSTLTHRHVPLVPLRYTAEWHWPGCLPDTDVIHWETAREAWNDLITRLEDYDGMYVPDDADDPDGPHSRSSFALALERMAESDRPGQVTDESGMVYSVEDTHVMRCETCQRTFPDLYPSGRCPFEVLHGSPERDPFRVYAVGDDDDTFHAAAMDDADFCDSREPEVGFVCTRWHIHEGNHAAGTSTHIAEVW